MSESGEPDVPEKAHAEDYNLLKVEHSLNDRPPENKGKEGKGRAEESQSEIAIQTEQPQLSDSEKIEAADAIRSELMTNYRNEGPHHPTDSVNEQRKLMSMDFEALTEYKKALEDKDNKAPEVSQADEARRAMIEKMEQKTQPPSPEEPTRPDTHDLSR